MDTKAFNKVRKSRTGTIVPVMTKDGKLELYVREEMDIIGNLRKADARDRSFDPAATLKATKNGRSVQLEFSHSGRDIPLHLSLRDSFRRLINQWKRGENVIITLIGPEYSEFVMGAALQWNQSYSR